MCGAVKLVIKGVIAAVGVAIGCGRGCRHGRRGRVVVVSPWPGDVDLSLRLQHLVRLGQGSARLVAALDTEHGARRRLGLRRHLLLRWFRRARRTHGDEGGGAAMREVERGGMWNLAGGERNNDDGRQNWHHFGVSMTWRARARRFVRRYRNTPLRAGLGW